jgi:TonB family protein
MRMTVGLLIAITATALAQVPPVGPHGEPAKAIALYAPKPDYPESIRKQHKGGAGAFELHVDIETGLVSSVSTRQSTGVSLLDRTCKAAFLRWRFKPHIVNRVRIPVSFTQTGTAQ